MLGLENNASGERLRKAVVAHHVKIPPFYGTRKDHKEVEIGLEEQGPKVRPVCGAEDCVTKRTSYLLCLIGENLLDNEPTHCDSTINLLEEIDKLNKSGQVNKELIIGSLDVNALYPSLDIKTCAKVFRDKLFESKMSFPGLSWKDCGLYLRFHMDEEDLIREGVVEYCPRRRTLVGHPPEFQASGVSDDESKKFGPWIFPTVPPNDEITRLLFCLAIECMIQVTMSLHDFQFNGVIYRQRTGGSIGLDLTGIIADVYMCHWDKEFIKRCAHEKILMYLYKRYKDDINVAADTSDSNLLKDDKSVMLKLKEIADSIDPCISVTTDCCSNHTDLKTPILDIKVWIDEIPGVGFRILHSHYIKEVATRHVMNESSSHGAQMKFHVMVNELDRIMRNVSPYLKWEESVVPSLDYFIKRMSFSGYSKFFMHRALVKALQKYDLRMNRFLAGQSYYTLKDVDTRSRNKKRKDWYVEKDKYESVMFVEATPNSTYKENVKKLVKKHKLKVRVVERAGETLKSALQKSDPFKKNTCTQPDCFICSNGIPINCRERGIVYELKCNLCEDRRYRGQTSRSSNTRTKEHHDDLTNEKEGSPFYKHKQLFHPNENCSFTVKILARCRQDVGG